MFASLKSRFAALTLPVLLAASLGACSDDATEAKLDAAKVDAVLENYSANLFAAYSDSVKDAEALKVKLQALIASPSQATLDAAKTEWLKSRANYMLTEGARFYDGPIDEEETNYEGLLNGWPFDEAYIDYVQDGPTREESTDDAPGAGGIIADESVALTAENLNALNTEGGDENISAGYHAIEFLLWGQALKNEGPGERSYTDYVESAEGPGKYAVRRGQYLIAAVDGIILNLTAVRDAWQQGASYRAEFVDGGEGSISKALSGLGRLSKGEMAGERINAGLVSKARRDQHNCFSSTTFIDYERDARGIRDMYLGNYGTNDGPGFDELVKANDLVVDSNLVKQLNGTIDKLKAMENVYFETAISGADGDPNRVKLTEIRESFRAQGDMFAEAANALGISLEIPEEN